jgi:DNA repair protein SbcC/Rad50
VRLHSLRVAAFGPFREGVEVDFDAVCSAGLFLIHGATGAGKTSLLDAVCFALFADVPGGRTKRALASDHAPEGTRPSVRLELTIGRRRLRIERSPEFQRPKRRGTGSVRVPAGVTLEEMRGSSWHPVSTRHDEVAEVVDGLLGMGLTQFAKVVVLPQGDVSAFLRASPEDRRALLERLFDVSTFVDVEAWLADERRRSALEVERLSEAVAREVVRLEDRIGADVTPTWTSVPVESLPEVLGEHLVEVETEVIALLAAADEAVGGLTRATAALHDGRARAATRRRGQRARADREAALSHRQKVDALRLEVHRASRADAVAGHLAALTSAREDEASCRAELDEAAAAAGFDADQARLEPRHIATVGARVSAADEAVAALDRAWGGLSDAEDALAAARHACRVAERGADRSRERVEQAQAAVDRLEERQAALAEAAGAVAAAEAAHADAVRRASLASEIAELTAAAREDVPELLTARDEVLGRQQAVIELRQRRLDGMAAELADALDDGQPCPVCGSAEHPARAARTDDVDETIVDVAESALARAQHRLVELERAGSAREGRLGALRAQLDAGTEDDLADLLVARDRAAAGLATALAARQRLDERTVDLVAARSRLDEAILAAAESDRHLAAARATEDAAHERTLRHRSRLAELRAAHADCPCVPGDSVKVGELVTAHMRRRAVLDRLSTALARLDAAESRRCERHDGATAAATERGFESLGDVVRARLDPRTLESHRADIGQHDQTLAVTEAILAEDEVASALDGTEPDLDALAEAEASARREARQSQAAHAAAEARLAVLRTVAGPLDTLVRRLRPARARAAAVKDLADAATGVGADNTYRMRLSSYVLAARLESVVALANERLARMDAGRYLLEHSDARASRGARSGLGLRVLDQWTGRSRDTASLSGGESFMVSLSLALGLADAVREESGGVDLGTLFVDEGFGSLDEDALEHVLGVLDDLREGGRAVGVVSHVPQLRARITHQVVVTKTPTGSDAAVRTGVA